MEDLEGLVTKGLLSTPKKGGVIRVRLQNFCFYAFICALLFVYMCVMYYVLHLLTTHTAEAHPINPLFPLILYTLITNHTLVTGSFAPLTLVSAIFIRPVTTFGLSNAVTEILAHDDQHFLVFDQVGQMAASTTYLHVMLPLNLSTLHHQADLITSELSPLTKLKTSNYSDLLLTKQLKDLGLSCIKRVARARSELQVLERILPQDARANSRVGKVLPILPILMVFGAIAIPATLIGAAVGTSASRKANTLKAELKRKAEQAAQSLKLELAYANYNTTRKLVFDRIAESFKILPPQYEELWDPSNFTIPDPPFVSNIIDEQYKAVDNHTQGLLDMLRGIDDQLYVFEVLPHERLPNPAKFRLPRDFEMDPSDRNALDYCNFLLHLQPLPENATDLERYEESLFELYEAQDRYIAFDNLPALARQKRFLETASLVAGILGQAARVVGTFMGLYNSAEIAAISSRISKLEHTNDLLVHLTNRHSRYLVELSHALITMNRNLLTYMAMNPAFLYIEINNHLVEYERRVARMSGVLQQLQHRRLSVDWLDDSQLTALHNSVLEFAEQRSMTLLTHHTSDYFQLELSYFRSGHDVTAILHIPCITTPTMLAIYRYVPFPIPLPAITSHSPFSIKEALGASRLHPDDGLPELSANVPGRYLDSEALYLVPDSDMIAISGDESFRLVSQTDLAGCIQRNHIFLCESQHVLRTNLSETCLGSLYKKSTSGVRANCRFDRRPLQEKVYQLSGSVYLVYAPSPFTTRVDCLNGSSFSAYFGQTTKLTVPSGCSVQLRSHTLRVDEKFHMPLPPEVTEWRWDLLSLPADLLGRSSYLDSSFVDLVGNLTQLRDDAALDNEIPTLVDGHIPFRSWFGIVMWCFVCLATITPFGMLGWYYYRRQRRLTRPTRYDLSNQYAVVLNAPHLPTPPSHTPLYPRMTSP